MNKRYGLNRFFFILSFHFGVAKGKFEKHYIPKKHDNLKTTNDLILSTCVSYPVQNSFRYQIFFFMHVRDKRPNMKVQISGF